MANDYTGRSIKLTTTGVIPLANFKVAGGRWQGMAAAGQVFTMVDVAGRTYDWTSYNANYPIDIGKLGWVSGPVTITSLPSGEVELYLDTK